MNELLPFTPAYVDNYTPQYTSEGGPSGPYVAGQQKNGSSGANELSTPVWGAAAACDGAQHMWVGWPAGTHEPAQNGVVTRLLDTTDGSIDDVFWPDIGIGWDFHFATLCKEFNSTENGVNLFFGDSVGSVGPDPVVSIEIDLAPSGTLTIASIADLIYRETAEFAIPVNALAGPSVIEVVFKKSNKQVDVYLNFVLVGTHQFSDAEAMRGYVTQTIYRRSVLNPTNGVDGGYLRLGTTFWNAGVRSNATALLLEDAWTINQDPNYTDPDPTCVPAGAPAQAQTQVYTRGWL